MKYLTPDERDEWFGLLDDANARPNLTTGERADLVLNLLDDAEQAQRAWAPLARRVIAADGAQKHLKARSKEQSTVLVPFNDVAIVRSMRVGIKGQRRSGAVGFQQKLFEELTWDELRDHASGMAVLYRSIGMTIAVDNKLLRLRQQYPESAGPAEACQQMGVTVAQFLEAVA